MIRMIVSLYLEHFNRDLETSPKEIDPTDQILGYLKVASKHIFCEDYTPSLLVSVNFPSAVAFGPILTPIAALRKHK